MFSHGSFGLTGLSGIFLSASLYAFSSFFFCCCSAAVCSSLFWPSLPPPLPCPIWACAGTASPGRTCLRPSKKTRCPCLAPSQGKDARGIVFQNRSATTARFRCTHPVITPALQPFDRRTGADLKALGRLTPRRPRFHCFDNALTQVTRQCFRHRRSPQGESMPIDSFNQTAKRIPPIQIQRNVLLVFVIWTFAEPAAPRTMTIRRQLLSKCHCDP